MLRLAGTFGSAGPRLTRREVMQVGSLAIGGLTLPQLLAARAGANPAASKKDTSVVLVFLPGGPSHIDTYDPKPSAPIESRGQYRTIPTNVPGIEVSELLPKQAQVMDKMAIVRTFSHNDGNHGSAVHWVVTGVEFGPADLGAPQIAPCPGSVTAKVRGTRAGVPPYVAFSRMPTSDGAAYLGQGCAPFEVAGKIREDLNLPGEIDLSRLNNRRELLGAFDALRRRGMASETTDGVDSFNRQALDIVSGGGIRNALDLSKEDPRTVAQYGPGLGEQMLLARRCCEAGASFVSINFGGRYGWDNHRNIYSFLNANLPVLDHAVATFVSDVAQRGLSERILLVVMGEMGRTPKMNDWAGRHHWPQVMFVTLAGGGLKMGQVVGKTSSKAETILTHPFHAQDLLATIYHVLGIDPGLQFADALGRPLPIISDGKAVSELL